jgi:hypothetical protein
MVDHVCRDQRLGAILVQVRASLVAFGSLTLGEAEALLRLSGRGHTTIVVSDAGQAGPGLGHQRFLSLLFRGRIVALRKHKGVVSPFHL